MSPDTPESPNGDKKRTSTVTGNAVRVTPQAFGQLGKQAKKLNLTNMEYASAAIQYFTQSGLDPTSQEMNGLISVRKKVGEDGQNTRKWMADVGNRIVAILRAFETILYKLLQGQQANTFAVPGAYRGQHPGASGSG